MSSKNSETQAASGMSTQLGVNELVKALLEQNRLREQQMDAILSKILTQRTEIPVTPTILPIVMQTIPKFNGESGDTDIASEWLNALNTEAVLNISGRMNVRWKPVDHNWKGLRNNGI